MGTLTTLIVLTGKVVLARASIASWITQGMKTNGLLAVPKHFVIFTTENCRRKDSFACKKVVMELSHLLFLPLSHNLHHASMDLLTAPKLLALGLGQGFVVAH